MSVVDLQDRLSESETLRILTEQTNQKLQQKVDWLQKQNVQLQQQIFKLSSELAFSAFENETVTVPPDRKQCSLTAGEVRNVGTSTTISASEVLEMTNEEVQLAFRQSLEDRKKAEELIIKLRRRADELKAMHGGDPLAGIDTSEECEWHLFCQWLRPRACALMSIPELQSQFERMCSLRVMGGVPNATPPTTPPQSSFTKQQQPHSLLANDSMIDPPSDNTFSFRKENLHLNTEVSPPRPAPIPFGPKAPETTWKLNSNAHTTIHSVPITPSKIIPFIPTNPTTSNFGTRIKQSGPIFTAQPPPPPPTAPVLSTCTTPEGATRISIQYPTSVHSSAAPPPPPSIGVLNGLGGATTPNNTTVRFNPTSSTGGAPAPITFHFESPNGPQGSPVIRFTKV